MLTKDEAESNAKRELPSLSKKLSCRRCSLRGRQIPSRGIPHRDRRLPLPLARATAPALRLAVPVKLLQRVTAPAAAAVPDVLTPSCPPVVLDAHKPRLLIRRPCQHPRSLVRVINIVLVLLIQQLPVRRLEVRRLDPVARDDAGQSDTDARRAVEPRGAGPARQALAEVRGEVVAVLGQEVVGGPQELLASRAHDGVDLGLGGEREAVQDLALEGAPRRLEFRLGPVDARDAWALVPAVGVLFAVDDDARVQEGGAEKPEG